MRRFLTRLLSVNDELDMGLCRYLRGAWRAVRPFIGSRIVDGSCYDECSLVVGGRPECDASEAQDVCRGDVAAQYCVCGPEADQLPVRTVTLAAPAGKARAARDDLAALASQLWHVCLVGWRRHCPVPTTVGGAPPRRQGVCAGRSCGM